MRDFNTKEKTLAVKFTTHCGIYMPGEVANFPEAEAQRYVKGRAGILAEPPKPQLPERKPDEKATMPPVETADMPKPRPTTK